MNVRMQRQRPAPGVQREDKAWLCPQVFGSPVNSLTVSPTASNKRPVITPGFKLHKGFNW